MASLAELRAHSGPAPLPTSGPHTVTLTEGQHLLARSEQLREELLDILAQTSRTNEDGERTGPPRKAAEGLPPRVEEIQAEQKRLFADLAQHQSGVTLRGISAGDWQRFKDDNPPREGNSSDVRVTGGWCNAAALIDALGRFVATWDDEALSPGDWDQHLAERVIYADRRDLATAVVNMYEAGVARAPKSSTSSSPTEPSATD